MRAHKLTLAAALAVAASLSLTACQHGTGSAGQSAPSPAPTGSSAPATSPSATTTSPDDTSGPGHADQGTAKDSTAKDSTAKDSTATNSGGTNSGGTSTAAGPGSPKSSGAGRCRTDELEITARDNTIDGDPDRTVVVELKNRGGRDCVIAGYAGVDLRTNAGSLSAARTGQGTTSSILRNGKSTYFPVEYPYNTSGGSGVRITALVVTPPNETTSVTLPWPGAATLPVTDGSGTPVKVGPVGSAGQGE
ncbi:DUF4232 domain-containing protein [Streptacidiphilus griseoplanus]|uniref:DUF4232 domain-containing protein n=1 Tax=Peterkaempfera griseoplana TaxID=66896 RepID=UPI0006E3A6CE|nr:DUF4232 domain-containing protein [Peterkaempfera griseoplana]